LSDIAESVSAIDQAKKAHARRSARPERITIGGVEFARNDVIAQEFGGVTERTVNRGDAKGAPYVMIGGVKFRPVEEYHKFLLTQIKRRNQSPKQRGQR
jgi:hypothetical protein